MNNNNNLIIDFEKYCEVIQSGKAYRFQMIYLLVKAAINIGKIPEALNLLQSEAAKHPNVPAFQNEMSKLYLASGQIEAALTCAKAASDHSPEVAEFIQQLNYIYGVYLDHVAAQKDIAGIEGMLTFSHLLPLTIADIHATLGQIYERSGNKDQAADHIALCLDLVPNHLSGLCLRARIQEFTGQEPEITRLQELLESGDITDRSRALVQVALFRIYDQIGDYDQAFKMISAANRYFAAENPYRIERPVRQVHELMGYYKERDLYEGESDPDDPTLIFMVGMSRSGKSLVQSLLAQSEEFIALDEDQVFVKSFINLVRKSGGRSPALLYLHKVPEVKLKSLVREYLAYLKREYPKGRYFINTLPANSMFLGLYFRIFPNISVIDCQRHPLDQIVTSYFKHYQVGNGYSYDLGNTGEYWLHYRSMIEHWIDLYPDKIRTIRYEDLVQKTEMICQQLKDHFNLSEAPEYDHLKLHDRYVGYWKNYKNHLSNMKEAYAKIGIET